MQRCNWPGTIKIECLTWIVLKQKRRAVQLKVRQRDKRNINSSLQIIADSRGWCRRLRATVQYMISSATHGQRRRSRPSVMIVRKQRNSTIRKAAAKMDRIQRQTRWTSKRTLCIGKWLIWWWEAIINWLLLSTINHWGALIDDEDVYRKWSGRWSNGKEFPTRASFFHYI